ncbi:MAG: UvrD-helicase domain-containing protein [Lutibacter sp.]|uniref:UvrD-helicase domain-containing protein n=1 Tax=Lutibacter sp. TaxID=1925666 RepID=UPI00299E4B71|nr:UvrD-helicase domain-containing protein [Lutibacter sp.]MDX1830104.1 UvrD-helicase domain-containing protein [Lutibacter sp.]
MLNTTSFQVYNASAGSGKTFTLVKEYLKILLNSSNKFKFQQILAVTFTNKAAGEMKERVIKNLNTFSKGEQNEMFKIIASELNLEDNIIATRSKTILNAILQNYAAFSITTIDSFTHKLIRTFAYDLHLPVNFDVEMDAESLLNEAVDLVISKIGTDSKLTDLLISYSIQKLEDDKAWDISNELKKFSKIILNENDAKNLKLIESVSMEDFKKIKAQLQKENIFIEKKLLEIGSKGLEIINGLGIEQNDFYRTQIPKHFSALASNPKRAKFFDQSTLKRNIENEVFYAKSKSDFIKNAIDSCIPTLLELYNQSETLFQQKTLNDLLLNSLIPLAVLNYINKALQEIKLENNLLLNAEFNQKINDTIKNEPAPFIYERIGEKYRYYFIDEMQDTSVLQWQNLIPLVENAISSENEDSEIGKLMLVGDAKQAIYRWRGGKAEQFVELSSNEENKASNPFVVNKNIKNLPVNYRSYNEIIKFNNRFFTHISNFLNNQSFQKLYTEGNQQEENEKIGGFVQISFVEKQKEDEEKDLVYAKKVLKIIENLDASFRKNEVCVLVRSKKPGVEIADFLLENNVEIMSSETLLLNNHPKIKFIINLLNFLNNEDDKSSKVKLLYFLYEHINCTEKKHHFITSLLNLDANNFYKELSKYGVYFNKNEFHQNPFYESVEYIVRSFNLTDDANSYIQFFLEVVFEFTQKNEASLTSFLDYWELKKDTLSIVAPEAENAVRIMTIHKAKGLEFPVIIYPYNLDIYSDKNSKVWYKNNKDSILKTTLINYGNALKYIGIQGEELYHKKREENELDNFNLIYVALTRAVEQLYVVLEKKINSKGEEDTKHSSGLFINFLKKENIWEPEKSTYNFGSPKRIQNTLKLSKKGINQQKFITNSWKNQNITIVANSSVLWGTEKGEAITYGNLIHEILSKIKTQNDIDDAIEPYKFNGTITQQEKIKILEIINKVITHKKLTPYFSQNATVFTEQEILTKEHAIVIPDRLVFDNQNVTILDYKTGKPEVKHEHQINTYAQVLEDLNYQVQKKILIYINDEILIKEI